MNIGQAFFHGEVVRIFQKILFRPRYGRVARSNKQRIDATRFLESWIAWLSAIYTFSTTVPFTKPASEAAVYTARSTFRHFAEISRRVKKACTEKK